MLQLFENSGVILFFSFFESKQPKFKGKLLVSFLYKNKIQAVIQNVTFREMHFFSSVIDMRLNIHTSFILMTP